VISGMVQKLGLAPSQIASAGEKTRFGEVPVPVFERGREADKVRCGKKYFEVPRVPFDVVVSADDV